MRLLIFILIELFLLPLQIVGVILYTFRLRKISIPQQISGTANEPYGARLLFHIARTRNDPTAYALAGHLPIYDGLVTFLIIKTLEFACRISGYRGWLFDFPGPRPSDLLTFISHRTAFFDHALHESLTREENPVRQLVILGAGFDTRCYDLPNAADVCCFEVDMAPTLKAKIKGLEAAGVAHQHVTFVETDFNQQSWMEALLNAGFDGAKTTFVLWEGVTMYIPEQSVRDTLRLAATLPEGSEVAFDYFSKELLDCETPYEKTGKRLVNQGMKYYGEALIFGISTRKPARDPLEQLVGECGLKLERFEHTHSENPPSIPAYCFATATTVA